MKPIKINFIPMNTRSKKPQSDELIPTLGIYKSGQLMFSKKAVDAYSLAGAPIKFVHDPAKRILGFRKLNGVPFNQLEPDMRILTPKKNGSVSAAVGRLLFKYNKIEKANYTGLKIDTYKDSMYGDVYYVRLPKVTSNA